MIRKAYLKKMTETLESLVREIESIPSRTEHAGEALRSKAAEEIEALHGLEKKARARIAELAEAGDAHWGKFKAGVDHSVDDLKKEVRKATDKVREKVSGFR